MPLPLWPSDQSSMGTETYQKLLRPGRTQHAERKIGFGRPMVPLKSFARTSHSEEDIATAQAGPSKRDQRAQRVRQRRRRRQQKQHPRRSTSSTAALPAMSDKVVLNRDSAWRHSTYDGGAQVVAWYAQDESRRFIKGNVKGALPPVQRTGLSKRATT